MKNDPRIGKYIIATNGTFTGAVSAIHQIEGGERFEVTGYDIRTDSRGLIRDVDPKSVVAVFVEDEALFQNGGWREHAVLATIECGTTEWLARILKPGSAEPEYFVPQGIHDGIMMGYRPLLETALHYTYPGIQIVSEEEFQQEMARRGEYER